MKTEKREQILKTALELFIAHGFKGTSTAGIARQAGVATGTLFHHFSTKEDLINELYLGAKTDLAEHLAASLNDSRSVREQIRCLWFAFAAWAIEHEDQYRFFKHCDASPYISEDSRRQGAARFAFVFDLFSEAVKNGIVKDLPVALLIDLFTGAMEGFIRHLFQNPDARGDEALWENAFSASWDAMR